MIQIKNLFTGAVLFELDAANLQRANLEGANLECADLEGANLRNANLRDANLRDANLESANLRDANLESANLRGAYLEGAYLEGAYLRGAYLEGADLEGADLRGTYLPIFCKWHVSHKIDNTIKIGCEKKSIEDWDTFFAGSECYDTPRDSPEFKRIRAVYEAYKTYLAILAE